MLSPILDQTHVSSCGSAASNFVADLILKAGIEFSYQQLIFQSEVDQISSPKVQSALLCSLGHLADLLRQSKALQDEFRQCTLCRQLDSFQAPLCRE